MNPIRLPLLLAAWFFLVQQVHGLGRTELTAVVGGIAVTENSYDAAGRLKARTLLSSLSGRPTQGVLAKFTWQHDAVGQVVEQKESWPQGGGGWSGLRSTTMAYDGIGRLTGEVIEGQGTTTTTAYAYDAANNRSTKTVTGGDDPGHWDYHYNSANQLTAWEKRDAPEGAVLRQATLTYDAAGNRSSQTVSGGAASAALAPAEAATGTTAYSWDAQDRLASVTTPDGGQHQYAYDYRTRRTATQETPASGPAKNRAVVYAGGVSLAEYEGSTPVSVTPQSVPAVHYLRGPDMGGGVGGMLYSLRSGSIKYSLSNGRGDIVAQSDAGRAITWQASYEAYGRRVKESGVNEDRQRANTKGEDPTGLLNEGFRYRDLETGVWLSRDPAGFVDGPNLYAYVKQNPWTSFDPDGLKTKAQWENVIKKNNSRNAEIGKRQNELSPSNLGRARTASEQSEYLKITREKGRNMLANAGASIAIEQLTASAKAVSFVSGEAVDQVLGYLDDEAPATKELFDAGLTLARTGRAAEIVASYYGGRIVGSLFGKLIGRIEGAVATSRIGITPTPRGPNIVGSPHNALRPTQDLIHPDIVAEKTAALLRGESVGSVKVIQTPDGAKYIIDGHHSYVAGQSAGVNVPVQVQKGAGPVGFKDWSETRYERFTPDE